MKVTKRSKREILIEHQSLLSEQTIRSLVEAKV